MIKIDHPMSDKTSETGSNEERGKRWSVDKSRRSSVSSYTSDGSSGSDGKPQVPDDEEQDFTLTRQYVCTCHGRGFELF
jgi:hypothetical protein